MGRLGSRIVAAAVVAGMAAGPAWTKTNYHSGIWNLLRGGGFFFVETGESSIRKIGSMTTSGKRYEIWRHAYVRTGGAGRAHFDLLIFEKTNKGLSYFDESPAQLRAAAAYLESFPADRALGKPRYGMIGKAKTGKRKTLYGSPNGPQPHRDLSR